MTVTVNKGLALASLAVSDNTVINANDIGGDRYSLNAVSCYNTTAAAITVDFYDSPDLTSLGGVHLERVIVLANDSADANALIAQGFESNDENGYRSVIAVPSAVGVNVKVSGNTYIGE